MLSCETQSIFQPGAVFITVVLSTLLAEFMLLLAFFPYMIAKWELD